MLKDWKSSGSRSDGVVTDEINMFPLYVHFGDYTMAMVSNFPRAFESQSGSCFVKVDIKHVQRCI